MPFLDRSAVCPYDLQHHRMLMGCYYSLFCFEFHCTLIPFRLCTTNHRGPLPPLPKWSKGRFRRGFLVWIKLRLARTSNRDDVEEGLEDESPLRAAPGSARASISGGMTSPEIRLHLTEDQGASSALPGARSAEAHAPPASRLMGGRLGSGRPQVLPIFRLEEVGRGANFPSQAAPHRLLHRCHSCLTPHMPSLPLDQPRT